MTSKGDLGEVLTGEGAVAEALDQLVGNLHLEEGLDGLDGVGVCGQTNTQAVVGEGGVAGGGGGVNVAVTRGDVPVALVEADAVDEELDGAEAGVGQGGGRVAQPGVDVEGAGDGLRSAIDIVGQGGVCLEELHKHLGDGELVCGRGEEDLLVLSTGGDGDVAVDAGGQSGGGESEGGIREGLDGGGTEDEGVNGGDDGAQEERSGGGATHDFLWCVCVSVCVCNGRVYQSTVLNEQVIE